jgi:magnesium transporter
MDEVDSDARADIFAVLNDDDREAILRQMSPDEAQDARALLAYPPNTAGGLMITEYLSYNARLSVEDVLKDMRENAERYSDYAVQYVYVTADDGKLEGVIRLRDLVMMPGSAPLSKIMIANPYHVTVSDTLEYLEQFFNRHVFFGMPVVDNFGKLVGVVQRADVEEAHGEAAAKTFLQFGGIIGGEELRSMPVSTRTTRRLLFLGPNIFLNVIAASVIALYENTLARVIALAVFLPIISDMSGCAGNQAVAVSIRELSLGLIKPKDFLRVWWKEMQVGVVNGIALCLLMMAVAFLWKREPSLALVVGTALGINTLVGVSFGGGIPLILRYFRLDPALAASPLLTTVTDMCGFFLSLSFATVALHWGLL